MDIVYGVIAPRPAKSTAEAFGTSVDPTPIKGGQGTAYRAGDIVLKPAEHEALENWVADIFESLPESKEVRFARPVKSVAGKWIYDGYVAWTLLRGSQAKGQYDKKLVASEAFHRLIKNVKKPDFLNVPQNSWAAASKVVLEGQEFPYDQQFVDLYNQIKPHLRPLPPDRQLVHGDLSGNFLLDPSMPPAIIDFSPAWAPKGFAEGVMLADIIAWENATDGELEIFRKRPNIGQLAWYGVLRRIAEQPEHIKWFGKSKAEAIKEARTFQRVIEFLGKHFPSY